MLIVIVGTICGNKTFHGPFQDHVHANQWASVNVGNQYYEIAPLDKEHPTIQRKIGVYSINRDNRHPQGDCGDPDCHQCHTRYIMDLTNLRKHGDEAGKWEDQ